MPGESRLALYDVDPGALRIVGVARLEAIAAEEALRFRVVDDAGEVVPRVEVSPSLREWPGYLRGSGPPAVSVLSGRWMPDPDPDAPPSRPEA